MKLFQTQQAINLISTSLTDVSDRDTLVTTFLPTRATKQSAGYDIRACIIEPIIIYAGESIKLPTGFHLQTEDPSLVGLVFVRSSIGMKLGLILSNAVGVIDADYPDQWYVTLHNLREQAVTIVPGQRIAQVVFTPVIHLEELQEHSFNKERTGGIGSTNPIELSYKVGELI